MKADILAGQPLSQNLHGSFICTAPTRLLSAEHESSKRQCARWAAARGGWRFYQASQPFEGPVANVAHGHSAGGAFAQEPGLAGLAD